MERTPLFIISDNRRRHTEYSSYQRELIAGVVVCEASSNSLKKRFEISKFFAQFILFNVLQRNNGDSLSRFDRLKMLSIRDERHIIRIARRELKIIYRELRSRVEVTCSHDILYRLLKEKNIINWMTKKRSLLILEMIDKRLLWTLQHEHWKYDDWIKII